MRDRFKATVGSRRSLWRTAAVAALALSFAFTVVAAAPARPAPTSSGVPATVHTLSVPAGYVVVIDAGHQAHADTRLEPIGPGSKTKRARVAGGTSGVVTKVHESVVNLQVALRLRTALKAAGITVVMVRTKESVDIANSARAKIANAAHAKLFVRIHCDGTASSIHGVLMLVPARNAWTRPIVAASARAGKDILAAVLSSTGASDRGTQLRGDLSGFNYSKVPSMLIEMGNMKNPTEDRALSSPSYQSKLVAGMVAGILAFAAGK